VKDADRCASLCHEDAFTNERSLFAYAAPCNSNEAAILRPTLRAVSSRFVAVDYTPGRIGNCGFYSWTTTSLKQKKGKRK